MLKNFFNSSDCSSAFFEIHLEPMIYIYIYIYIYRTTTAKEKARSINHAQAYNKL